MPIIKALTYFISKFVTYEIRVIATLFDLSRDLIGSLPRPARASPETYKPNLRKLQPELNCQHIANRDSAPELQKHALFPECRLLYLYT